MWLSTGLEHILDIRAYDHLLFVSLLALNFAPGQWKQLLILITAFTLGHSCSLALSVGFRFALPQDLIELLIALSILSTAVYQLANFKGQDNRSLTTLYGIVAFFGLVHGLGFSFLLRSLLGQEESIFLPLLYFNLGLELGQLILVGGLAVFSLLLSLLSKTAFKSFKLILICIIAIIALKITIARLFYLF